MKRRNSGNGMLAAVLGVIALVLIAIAYHSSLVGLQLVAPTPAAMPTPNEGGERSLVCQVATDQLTGICQLPVTIEQGGTMACTQLSLDRAVCWPIAGRDPQQ